MKNNIFRKIATGLLLSVLSVSCVLSDTGLTAYAVDTNVSDDSVSGTGSVSGAKGQWHTSLEAPTVYRIYPIGVPDIGDIKDDYTLSYNNYYTYRDIAVYEISGENIDTALDSYALTSSTTKTALKLKDSHLVLGVDKGNSFKQLDIDLSLPTQGFSATKPKYKEFSNQLEEAITTHENGNVQKILSNYIEYLDSKRNDFSKRQKDELEKLKQVTAYGTGDYTKAAKRIGLCVEVCSVASNNSGTHYIFSWGDLQETGVTDDAYYIYHPLDMANDEHKLLTWKASLTNNYGNFTIKPEYNGNAVFLSYKVDPSDGYSQGINATLFYTGDVKANVNDTADSQLGISTTSYTTKTTTLKNLGGTDYNEVIQNGFKGKTVDYMTPKLYSVGNEYNDSLVGTAGSNINKNSLNVPDSSDTNYGVSAYGNLNSDDIDRISKNNMYLQGYITVAYNVDDKALTLADIYKAREGLLNMLKSAKAVTEADNISDRHGNAFGNSYSIMFLGKNGVLSNSVSNVVTDNVTGLRMTGASLIANQEAIYDDGEPEYQNNINDTITTLANLQSSTLLAGKISGKLNDDGTVKNANGKIFSTASYVVKRTYVKSKMSKVDLQQQYDENGNQSIEIENADPTKGSKYLVQNKKTWDVTGKGDAYAIVYKTGDYDMKDSVSLVNQMKGKLPTTISKKSGASNLASAFHDITGVEVQGYKYLGYGDTSVSVGSVAKDAEGNLDGLSVLVIYVNPLTVTNNKSADSLGSNELNYVYPSLQGQRSSAGNIVALGSGVSDMVYPYTVKQNISGDLTDFKGTDALYYYSTMGLFGVANKDTKTFNETSYPSYAYNMPRGLWNDNLVACNYRDLVVNSSDVRNFIRNDLGITVGAKGKATGVSAGVNVDATLKDTKHDSYSFVANILRDWVTTETGTRKNKKGKDESYTYQQEHTENVTQSSNYDVTHKCDKYDPLVLGTAGNDNGGTAAFSVQTGKDLDNKLALVGMSDKKLTVYGEVPFKMYYPYFSSNGVLSSVDPMTVYVMSEKARSMTPTILNGYTLDYTKESGVAADGVISSSTFASGTNVKALSNKYGNLPVVYAGGNINYKSSDDVAIILSSYALDITHEKINGVDVRNEFSSSNADYKTDKEHDAYVSDFMKNLKTNITMKTFNGSALVKSYNMIQATSRKAKVVKDTKSNCFSLEFKNGVLTHGSKDAVISDMAKTYEVSKEKATEMFKNAGFEKQIQDMFEDCLDSKNKSHEKWYTEDSVTLVINKYTTVIKGGDTVFGSKIDIQAGPSQDQYDIRKNGTKGYRADFFITLSLPKNFTIGETVYDLQGKNTIVKEQKVKNASFIISDSTTSDMKR